MNIHHILFSLCLAVLPLLPAMGQEAATRLTLADAVSIARHNSVEAAVALNELYSGPL